VGKGKNYLTQMTGDKKNDNFPTPKGKIPGSQHKTGCESQKSFHSSDN
jgi:hypothetical protein